MGLAPKAVLNHIAQKLSEVFAKHLNRIKSQKQIFIYSKIKKNSVTFFALINGGENPYKYILYVKYSN